MADETLTAKHSPTPWRVCGAPQCKCGLVWSLPADMVVAIAQGPQHEEDAPTPTTEQQAANAAHIVACVNERDGLLAETEWLKASLAEVTLRKNELEITVVGAMTDRREAVDLARLLRTMLLAREFDTYNGDHLECSCCAGSEYKPHATDCPFIALVNKTGAT